VAEGDDAAADAGGGAAAAALGSGRTAQEGGAAAAVLPKPPLPNDWSRCVDVLGISQLCAAELDQRVDVCPAVAALSLLANEAGLYAELERVVGAEHAADVVCCLRGYLAVPQARDAPALQPVGASASAAALQTGGALPPVGASAATAAAQARGSPPPLHANITAVTAEAGGAPPHGATRSGAAEAQAGSRQAPAP
jgi:hypothetical protein